MDEGELESLRQSLVETMRSTDRLTVLLNEVAATRADNRDSLSSMLTLITGMGALYGVFFYVIFTSKTAFEDIPTPLWAFLPAVPFGLMGYLIYIGTQGSIRSEYLIRLEREIWRETGYSLRLLNERRDGKPIPLPAYSHLLMPQIRTNTSSYWGTVLLVVSGVSVLIGSLGVIIVTAVLGADGLGWKVGIGVFYGIYWMLAVFRVFHTTTRSSSVWKVSANYAQLDRSPRF